MQNRCLGALLAFVFSATLWGCSTDFDVYAPEKEIRSVYCVLNTQDTVQYVRIAKAFQFEGDAIAYAASNDLSVSGLTVKLTGNGKTWNGIEVPNFPKDSGDFYASHTVYKFITDGSGTGRDTLRPETEYTLEIGTPEQPGYVTGKTRTPAFPRIRGDLSIIPGAGNSQCLPRLFLDRKLNFFWRRDTDLGVHYEVRVGFKFKANAEDRQVNWGPTKLFSENKGCNEGSGSVCYQFQEFELLRDFFREMPELPLTVYTYNRTDSCVANPSLMANLPKSLWFEVTAVDEFLSNYMIINDPSVTDLNGSRPEYTNLTGNITIVGVFGSYNLDRRYAIMRECSEALLGLNGTPTPVSCEWP